jgi:hypothetical protein
MRQKGIPLFKIGIKNSLAPGGEAGADFEGGTDEE